MAKFLIGVLVGFLLFALTLVILVFSVARLREKPPAIAENSTLVLTLDDELPERPPVEFPIPFFEMRQPITVQQVWNMLRMAAADSRIKAVVLEPRGLKTGWAKLEELRADLVQFRKSGKPLYVFLRAPGAREYYLATAGERIYMAPADMLNLKGMRFELMFFRNTLDKLGVQVQIEHAGKYKDFGDTFTRTSMSPETREVLTSLLDNLYGNLLQRIAEGRKRTPEQARAIVEQGPFTSDQALAQGLVDEIRFEDQVFGELQAKLKSGEIKKVKPQTYAKISPSSVGLGGGSRIAYVVGEGAITRGDPEDTGLSDDGLKSSGFDKLLNRVANDKSIKGVIVRIDSPGGEVAASDEIWREMNLLSKKKPVVISFSDTAASGGYYMSMTGDPIVAYPGTVTGSIGVVFGKPVLKGLYNKVGITKDILARGRFATIDSDYEPLDAAGQAKLREGIDATYRDFVSKVAAARKRKYEEIDTIAQGRVWLGSQAKQNGLVDELGGIDRAVDMVKKKAGIKDNVSLVIYPPQRSIFDVLFGSGAGSEVDALLKKAHVRMWLEGGMMRVMPYSIQVY